MRGRTVTHRFVQWSGPFPTPGQGLQYESGRRYVIVSVTRPPRQTATLFRAHVLELGAEDPDPQPLYPCVRDVRRKK